MIAEQKCLWLAHSGTWSNLLNKIELKFGSTRGRANLSFDPSRVLIVVGPHNSGKSLFIKELPRKAPMKASCGCGLLSERDAMSHALKPPYQRTLQRFCLTLLEEVASEFFVRRLGLQNMPGNHDNRMRDGH